MGILEIISGVLLIACSVVIILRAGGKWFKTSH